MHTVNHWSTLPLDTQYYDTLHQIALKQENNKVFEWNCTKRMWVNSTDYISWIPVNQHMIKNPNYVALYVQ